MSGITLSAVKPTAEAAPALVVVEQDSKPLRVERGDSLPPLVIARRADGSLLLAREVTRKGKDGAPDSTAVKATALLSDMADAIARGLLAP